MQYTYAAYSMHNFVDVIKKTNPISQCSFSIAILVSLLIMIQKTLFSGCRNPQKQLCTYTILFFDTVSEGKITKIVYCDPYKKCFRNIYIFYHTVKFGGDDRTTALARIAQYLPFANKTLSEVTD